MRTLCRVGERKLSRQWNVAGLLVCWLCSGQDESVILIVEPPAGLSS